MSTVALTGDRGSFHITPRMILDMMTDWDVVTAELTAAAEARPELCIHRTDDPTVAGFIIEWHPREEHDMQSETTVETREQLYARAAADPDSLTEEDRQIIRDDLQRVAEQIGGSINELVRLLTPAFQALVDVFQQFAQAVAGLSRQIPTRRQMRRWRKEEQIAAHRERVAARVPAWKRG